MPKRNVTLSLDEDLLRQARVQAAHADVSLSQMVNEILHANMPGYIGYAQAWAREERKMETGIGMALGPITWTRDEVHER